MPTYLSARALAERYTVTLATITTWRRRKKIPFIRMGYRTILYDPLACDQALARHARIPRWLRP
jgi:hypothetical protein